MLPEDIRQRFIPEIPEGYKDASKELLRQDIARQTEEFLARGGKIEYVPILEGREYIERIRNMNRKALEKYRRELACIDKE